MLALYAPDLAEADKETLRALLELRDARSGYTSTMTGSTIGRRRVRS
jgi:hypothetical protein